MKSGRRIQENRKEVVALFTKVAPRYQLATRILSFGCDKRWKNELIKNLPDKSAPVCLDIACGTGDIALLLKEKYPDSQITAADPTPLMLELLKKRPGTESIHILQSGAEELAASNKTYDIITGGYALRNFNNLEKGIEHLSDLLKSGGTACFLEFRMGQRSFGDFVRLYLLALWGGIWGLLLHFDPRIYAYLAFSLKSLPSDSRMLEIFHMHSLVDDGSKTIFFGYIRLWKFTKKP